MTNSELEVVRDLCQELVYQRSSAERLRDSLDKARIELKGNNESSERISEQIAYYSKELARMRNELTEAVAARDDAQAKLGEWARFVNYQVYERLNKFVNKGITASAKLHNLEDIVDNVLLTMEAFQEKHPVVLIEGGKAK